MNGILDTLVLRERGQADALAPRLPALFESMPVADELPMPGERTVVPTHAAAAPVESPPRHTPAHHAASVEAPRHVTASPMLVAAPQPARIDRALAAPPAAPTPQPGTVHTIETRTQPVLRVERETVRMPAQRLAVPPQPWPQAGAVQQPALPQEPAPHAAQPVRTPAAPAPIVPARRPIEARVVPAYVPQAERAQTVQPRQRAMAQPAAAPQPLAPLQAPDVRITIGRVEVRASSAPVRPTRAASGPAPVSLDQYLSQRNKQGTP